MKKYKADLHVHTVLSPCGDLDMSPVRIIEKAREMDIDILGVTDHNSTLHCEVMKKLGDQKGIFILPGCEVNSAEEVHCLTFFEDIDTCRKFQQLIDSWMPVIKNKPQFFGHQVVVNEHEEIIDEVENLLISALNADINTIAKEVYRLNGIFIPAHIERSANGILHQLGFIPDELKYDALELSWRTKHETFLEKNEHLRDKAFITSSDAHYLEDIARGFTHFKMEELSFNAIRKALANAKHQIEVA